MRAGVTDWSELSVRCASTTTQWGREGHPPHLQPVGKGALKGPLGGLDVCPLEKGGDNGLVSDTHQINLKHRSRLG